MRLNLSSLLGATPTQGSAGTSASDPGIFEAVRGAYIFEGLDDEMVRSFLSQCSTRIFSAGETVFSAGDESDGNAYIILSWEGEIVMGSDTATVSARGMIFGDNALISPDPRDFTVRALTELECLVVSQETFMSFASEHYDLNKVMYRAIQRDFEVKHPEEA